MFGGKKHILAKFLLGLLLRKYLVDADDVSGVLGGRPLVRRVHGRARYGRHLAHGGRGRGGGGEKGIERKKERKKETKGEN